MTSASLSSDENCIPSVYLKGLAQAEIIKKIGDFILASLYDYMM